LSKPMIPNVLASRYASSGMANIWSAENKIAIERHLWIAVLKAQKDLGIDIPQEAIAAYEKALPNINLDSINEREKLTRHDVKARIEEFCELAGFEHIHKGMTSRDLTENVEQLQIVEASYYIRIKALATASRLAELAVRYTDVALTGRSHNVAAQTTTLGKRFASAAEELLHSIERLDDLLSRYPLRGIKAQLELRKTCWIFSMEMPANLLNLNPELRSILESRMF